MEIIIKKNWEYVLYKKDTKLILSVVCGTIALFDIDIVLNTDELNKYNILGETYLNQLVDDIRSSPSKWKERKIN